MTGDAEAEANAETDRVGAACAVEGLLLSEVSLHLRGEPLMPPLSLQVARGEVVTLMGPSGVGKSSLLALLCGLLDLSFTASGHITVDGEDLQPLAPEKRRLGILFQDDLLFPHLSVGANLAFALPRAIKGKARQARVDEALAAADLAGMAARDPATLSGGQRARVALMRVLLAEPRALLLDEPFSKLDPQTRETIRSFVFRHARAKGLPTLMVTHDPEDAAAAGGRVLHLTQGATAQG